MGVATGRLPRVWGMLWQLPRRPRRLLEPLDKAEALHLEVVPRLLRYTVHVVFQKTRKIVNNLALPWQHCSLSEGVYSRQNLEQINLLMYNVHYILGMCRKLKVCFDSNRTVQNFDMRSDGFPTETSPNPQFKLKVTKITLLAFNMQTKNV